MSLVDLQFAELQNECPAATLQRLGSGAYLVTVPDYELLPGWSRAKTTIRFIAPPGYPMAKPDCFWTDSDLRVGTSGMPQASGMNVLPEVGTPQLWFSWHVQTWNANIDTLLTYFHVIERRLMEVR
jgi:hypothetical protein